MDVGSCYFGIYRRLVLLGRVEQDGTEPDHPTVVFGDDEIEGLRIDCRRIVGRFTAPRPRDDLFSVVSLQTEFFDGFEVDTTNGFAIFWHCLPDVHGYGFVYDHNTVYGPADGICWIQDTRSNPGTDLAGPSRSSIAVGGDGTAVDGARSRTGVYKPLARPLTCMNVECNFFGPFREAVGGKTIVREVESDATVGDLLADLVAEYELDGVLTDEGDLGAVTVSNNGTNVVHLDGLETALDDGDVLRLAPPVVGGGSV